MEAFEMTSLIQQNKHTFGCMCVWWCAVLWHRGSLCPPAIAAICGGETLTPDTHVHAHNSHIIFRPAEVKHCCASADITSGEVSTDCLGLWIWQPAQLYLTREGGCALALQMTHFTSYHSIRCQCGSLRCDWSHMWGLSGIGRCLPSFLKNQHG